MDKINTIPVDTHVFQIAQRDYHLSAKSLTPKLYRTIGELFYNIFGEYCGWAHTVLFAAELPWTNGKKISEKKSAKSKVKKEVENLEPNEGIVDEKPLLLKRKRKAEAEHILL